MKRKNRIVLLLLASTFFLCSCQTESSPGGQTPPLDDSLTLSSLVLSASTLSPEFKKDVADYTASVDTSVSEITLTPTLTISSGMIIINDTLVPSGSPTAPISLSFGENIITIKVIPKEGTTLHIYTLKITQNLPIITLSGVSQVGGVPGTTTTTSLTLTFDADPTTLTADNITLTGATKGALSGSGTTRTLAISDITVPDGATVSVAITSPASYIITGSPKTVAVYKEKNWQIQTLDASGFVGEYSSLRIDSNGKVHIIYYDRTNGGLKYTTNISGAWVNSVFGAGGDAEPDTSSIGIDSAGKIHISYLYDYNNADLKYTTNISGSWETTTLDTTGQVGFYNSLSIDQGGKIHISYIDLTNGGLKYATNASGSWITTTLDADGTVIWSTSLAIDSNGKVHISYSNGRLKYATNTSGSWVTTTLDSTGNVGTNNSLGIDSNRKIHISYYDGANGDLRYSTNASGSWVSTTLDSSGVVGEFSSLGLDSGGKIHISYYDRTNKLLKYATNASGSWVLSILDNTAYDVGWFPSLGIDNNGKVHVSYYNYTNGDLKYATK